MERYGGCGVLPSGACHLQVPTTVEDRSCDAPRVLPVLSAGEVSRQAGRAS